MQPWYRVATLRRQVREGRSFSPDEFAISLEQVVAGTAPPDYSDPAQFFARTCFTRALREHAGMALRRLAGRTENTAPVLTLITQFGGGKTHTLTSLHHLAGTGEAAAGFPGVQGLLDGSLTRLSDPEKVLKRQIAAFVAAGEFGLASGARTKGGYGRVWFAEPVRPEEIAFDPDVFLLTKGKADALSAGLDPTPTARPQPAVVREKPEQKPMPPPATPESRTTLQILGTAPAEVWNRLGIRILPKLRSLDDLRVGIELSATASTEKGRNIKVELQQALEDLDLGSRVRIVMLDSRSDGSQGSETPTP